MSKRKTTRYVQNIEIEEFEDGNCDVFVIPQDDDPNDSESEDTDNSQNNMQVMSYSEVLNNYTENQSQLEPGYTYDWINGEKNPDLMIHLKTIGLKSTGTVRKNRVQTDNKLDNKASRGTIAVKHEKKSGLNFITVMDSQPVSLLSTAAGVEPLAKRKRYSKNLQSTNEIPFPSAINVYNDFMGGVDMHDEHCSNLMPFIRAKKWTWPMFLRLIQSSLTNALVIYNLSHSGEKLGSFDMALAVAEHYIIKKADEKHILFHEKTKSEQKKNCKNFTKCSKRTTNMCIDCDAYFCDPCFKFAHKNM
uniref:PiggyBac transposable element-derived protein domain-containing protein n=1 Tax=Trichogramma kaykai TaxID=54128 RepID=A0ABD2WIJ9_9HYME